MSRVPVHPASPLNTSAQEREELKRLARSILPQGKGAPRVTVRLPAAMRSQFIAYAERKLRAFFSLMEEGSNTEVELVFTLRRSESGALFMTHRIFQIR